MSSNESSAYKIMKMLDVDYVLVIFGGVIGYSGDDINKFLWMVRIAEGEHPQEIKVEMKKKTCSFLFLFQNIYNRPFLCFFCVVQKRPAPTYIETLRRDTVIGNISEIRALMNNSDLWRAIIVISELVMANSLVHSQLFVVAFQFGILSG